MSEVKFLLKEPTSKESTLIYLYFRFNSQVLKHSVGQKINPKFWKIGKWWSYWLEVRAKHGITPRDENYKPSSAFDVRQVTANNIKGIGNYLTKYVTKNESKFTCQVWNCSRKISKLYTSFYSGIEFIRQLERLEQEQLLGGSLKVIPQEWCNIVLVPLNRTTTPFYNKIDEKNLSILNNQN